MAKGGHPPDPPHDALRKVINKLLSKFVNKFFVKFARMNILRRRSGAQPR